MATLGKDVKGKKKKGAKLAAQKAKLSTMTTGDMARQMAEQSKRILLERFKAEEAQSRAQAVKIEASWMQILRMTAVSSLRSDVEVLAAQHERNCTHRDATLRMMFDDLMAAEEQYRVALYNHLGQMDKIIELQDVRITDLETAFDDELRILHNDYAAEMSNIQRSHVVERRELRSILATVAELEGAKASEAEHVHVTAREEVRNRSTDRVQELSRLLDDRIMELEAAFEAAHVNYLHATDAKTESFKALVSEASKAEKRIERRAEAVDRAKAALVSLRNKAVANAREYEEKNAALAQERGEQSAHVGALKGRLDGFRAASDGRLQRLSVAARAARGRMDAQVALASRILQTAERCRQLEGDAERVAPVPVPDVAAGVGADADAVLAGPGASVRAAAALRLTAAAAGGGWAQQPLPAAVYALADGPDPALAPSPMRTLVANAARVAASSELRAASATMTAGGLVPPELTAARHGYVPLSDGAAPRRPASGPATAARLIQTRADDSAAAAADYEREVAEAAAGGGGGAEGTAASEAAALAASGLAAAAFADITALAGADAGASRLMRATVHAGEGDAMDLFWRRFNSALLGRLALEARHAAAARENAELHALLRRCVDGVTVSDAALNTDAGGGQQCWAAGGGAATGGCNPLLTINNRSGVLPETAAAQRAKSAAAAAGGRGPVTVDGSAAARTYALQGTGAVRGR